MNLIYMEVMGSKVYTGTTDSNRYLRKGRGILERKILEFVSSNAKGMLDTIERIVNIDSGSHNTQGTTLVGRVLADFLVGYGYVVEEVPCGNYGSSYVLRKHGSLGRIVLMGHTDTVFLDGEVLRRPFRVAGGRAYGPGVADMKAGLVTTAYAAAALASAGWAQREIAIIWNSHEEVGSKTARAIIEREARGADAVFNMEPARANGALVTGRKGVAWATLRAHGKAVHAGVEPEKGVNAIEELCHKAIALNRLTNFEKGTTVSVGLFKGGTATNVVPDLAELHADIRFKEFKEVEATVKAIELIAQTSVLPNARCECTVDVNFNPMERTPGVQALFERAQLVARDLGFSVQEAYTGGGADSGFTTAVGAPTLCGMGPVGGGSHSLEEYIEVDSIVPRAQLLALCMART